ncbi:unnamed protein product [Closterium sp. NIES-64]|nr:unnamed protein product [Closterium sp. NIES-64]
MGAIGCAACACFPVAQGVHMVSRWADVSGGQSSLGRRVASLRFGSASSESPFCAASDAPPPCACCCVVLAEAHARGSNPSPHGVVRSRKGIYIYERERILSLNTKAMRSDYPPSDPSDPLQNPLHHCSVPVHASTLRLPRRGGASRPKEVLCQYRPDCGGSQNLPQGGSSRGGALRGRAESAAQEGAVRVRSEDPPSEGRHEIRLNAVSGWGGLSAGASPWQHGVSLNENQGRPDVLPNKHGTESVAPSGGVAWVNIGMQSEGRIVWKWKGSTEGSRSSRINSSGDVLRIGLPVAAAVEAHVPN